MLDKLDCPYECAKTEENTCCLECFFFGEDCKDSGHCCCYCFDEFDKGCNKYKIYKKQKSLKS